MASDRDQHRTDTSNRAPRNGTIDERASSSNWTSMPPVCEPTKPAGTPPSMGGNKGGRG
jgi:hypothetical protein